MATETLQAKTLSKTEKAAVLFLCMDEKTTGELFGQMQDDEIRKIASALLHLNQVPTTQLQQVMGEFVAGVIESAKKRATEEPPTDIAIDGGKITQNLISRSMDRGRSRQILSNLNEPVRTQATPEDEANFRNLIQDCPQDDLYEIIEHEHPQIVAIALANAKRAVVKTILDKLPEEIQVDILSRMARLEKISGNAMARLRNYVSQKINDRRRGIKPVEAVKKEKVVEDLAIEGLGDTVKLLKSLGRAKSNKLVDEITRVDSELGEMISKQMFTIEDLERANDPGIRELLRNITNDDLKVSLKNAPDAVKDKVFKNMSERAALILKEDMEVMGPLKVEEIEASQNNILKAAKDLMKEEKLVLEEIKDEEAA